ncbi:hypothetical protein HYW76_04650 [Candidatus Pacearchaeota archaeon]|nr:hypothetical protein [Candidatus Pacearchaeota archaeon]
MKLKLRYPKITIFVIMIIFAYFIFRNQEVNNFISHLGNIGYLGVFIAGLLFSFGFTTPFAIGFFVVLNPENILLAGIIGGFGALISDMIIFKFVRFSFSKEFSKIKKSKLIRETEKIIENNLSKKIQIYLLYAIAGFIIASPLPDEAGITILAGMTKIKQIDIAKIGFVFNTLGIIILLMI